MAMKTSKELWLAIALILAAIMFMVAVPLRWVNVGFLIGPYRLNHWATWIGTLYIAFAVPLYAVFKRRIPPKMKVLLRIHVYGNLLAFLLISIHFTSQLSRPTLPDLGTGLALSVVMSLLTATGFLHRFRILTSLKPQSNRFLHVSVAVSFYIIIGIHILHGVGII